MMDPVVPPVDVPAKPRKPRAPRAKKKEPPKRHKAMITAVSALVIAATDFVLTLRYGLKFF